MIFSRNATDPLFRILLDKYNLNLLTVPRENAKIGDLYVYDGKRTSTPGSITYFLEPPLQIPPINTGEIMADVIGKVSNGFSLDLGLGFLESFLAVMGAAGLVTKVRAGFEAKGANTLKFHFSQSTRDSVDVMLLGTEFTERRIKEGHALYVEGYRYYFVTGVVRSPSISIIASKDDSASVNLDLEAIKVADLSAGVSVTSSSEGELTFAGGKSLAFGVELYELKYDTKRKQLRMALTDVVQLRAGGTAQKAAKPAFVGDPQGDAFITVE